MSPDDAIVLAGEYVLDLLDSQDRARAEALRQTDAQFSAAVLAWETQLMPIADAVQPVAPPGRLWERIRVASQQAAPRPARKFAGRRIFIGAGLLAACLAVFLWRGQTPATHELISLASTGGGTFDVRETAQKTMIVNAENISLPAGKTAELWVILPGQAPVAAGLLRAGQSVSATVPRGVMSLVLAVSVEPAGGSPTGGPTGPIIAEGKITKL